MVWCTEQKTKKLVGISAAVPVYNSNKMVFQKVQAS